MQLKNVVYHGTNVQDLKLIEGRQGTHKQEWVYAAKEIAIASVFIAKEKLGDFATMMGVNPQTYICERFKGALERLYDNTKGSIYVLPSETFKSEKNIFELELVSEESVVPLEEIKIENNLHFLQSLEKEGKIKIYRYPDRPDFIPEDDEDIVFKAVIWSKQFGKNTLEALKNLQPHLVDRVISIIENESLQVEKFDEWLRLFTPYKSYILGALESDFPDVHNQLKDKYRD